MSRAPASRRITESRSSSIRLFSALLSQSVVRPVSPAQLARPPRVPEDEVVPFTRGEAAGILKAFQDCRNGVRFIVAVTLGLRKGEALGLQWRDIDFTGRTLQIRRLLQPMR